MLPFSLISLESSEGNMVMDQFKPILKCKPGYGMATDKKTVYGGLRKQYQVHCQLRLGLC